MSNVEWIEKKILREAVGTLEKWGFAQVGLGILPIHWWLWHCGLFWDFARRNVGDIPNVGGANKRRLQGTH